MSAPPSTADIRQGNGYVSFVPENETARAVERCGRRRNTSCPDDEERQSHSRQEQLHDRQDQESGCNHTENPANCIRTAKDSNDETRAIRQTPAILTSGSKQFRLDRVEVL